MREIRNFTKITIFFFNFLLFVSKTWKFLRAENIYIYFFNLRYSFWCLLDSAAWGGCTTCPTLVTPLVRNNKVQNTEPWPERLHVLQGKRNTSSCIDIFLCTMSNVNEAANFNSLAIFHNSFLGRVIVFWAGTEIVNCTSSCTVTGEEEHLANKMSQWHKASNIRQQLSIPIFWELSIL